MLLCIYWHIVYEEFSGDSRNSVQGRSTYSETKRGGISIYNANTIHIIFHSLISLIMTY